MSLIKSSSTLHINTIIILFGTIVAVWKQMRLGGALLNGFITKQSKKVEKMRFKTGQSYIPTVDELIDGGEQQLPPEQRSTLMNDPNNPFRTLIENIRTLVTNSVEDEAQEFMVVFSVDQQTGFMSMGLVRQNLKKEDEGNEQKFRENIDPIIQKLEKTQLEMLREHSRTFQKTRDAKIFYQNWKKKSEEHSPLLRVNRNWMEMLDNPRMGKERSDSRDTAQTLAQYLPISPEDDSSVGQESLVDLSYMMQVE